jgi:acetoin utilization deacetylase AcuC-like enzyme
MKIPTVFHKDYSANTSTSSMRKLLPVATEAERSLFATLIPPKDSHLVGIEDKLKKIHCSHYVESFMAGRGSLASSNGFDWTESIRNGVLAMNAGMLTAAELAKSNGVAANVSQGFHHSRPKYGAGFCTFNGLALVANENKKQKVFVLDCDQHGGDGTAEFALTLPNLFNYSICGSTFGTQKHKRSVVDYIQGPINKDFSPYEAALSRAFKQVEKVNPDLVIYQAGADPHIDDPFGSVGLTNEQMFLRDKIVFEYFKSKKIPIFFVLAGGYQDMDNLVKLHVGTFKAASQAFETR